MTRNMFGWDLPPGCTQRHIDEATGVDDLLCECCGRESGDCICPACSYCGVFGDPKCYESGHDCTKTDRIVKLEYSKEQLIGQTKLRIKQLRDQITYHEQYLAYIYNEE